jgi:type IV pilus assembly protein PilQ
MKRYIKILISLALVGYFSSCSSTPTGSDDTSSADNNSDGSGFEESSNSNVDSDANSELKPEKSTESNDSLDKEFSEVASESKDSDVVAQSSGSGSGSDSEVNETQEPDLALDSDIEMTPQAVTEQTQPSQQQTPPPPSEAPPPLETTPPPPEIIHDTASSDLPPPPENAIPAQAEPEPVLQPELPQPIISSNGKVNEITNIKFESNESGGTVVIQGNVPLSYTTRTNLQQKQFIIEVENAHLQDKLKHPFNTRDFSGAVGAIDAYQSVGTNTARIVIQLRDGVQEPIVQQEQNSLLVLTQLPAMEKKSERIASPDSNGAADSNTLVAEGALTEKSSSDDGSRTDNSTNENRGILSSENLAEFMSSNMKFSGKRISIETRKIDIRDAIALIADESGANLIIAEEVRGDLSLKLRQVPWDQALVMIMKAKKLGYSKQGNVLRIAPLEELKTEEESAVKMAELHKKLSPLRVQMIPVSYAKIDELKAQVSEFKSERGRIVSDVRTSSLIITDTEEVIDRISKLVSSLDVAPPQVLIEGKIVEARETFNKSVGVKWNLSNSEIGLGDGAKGPMNLRPSLAVNGGNPSSSSALGFNVSIGTLDVLGNIDAVLAMQESLNNVKVISSPRIVTIQNEPAEINQSSSAPYESAEVSQGTGGTPVKKVEFYKLTMNLKVVPQITNDNSVMLAVEINRDFNDAAAAGAPPAVNSRAAKTKVLVRNGQTAVIGGIYQNDNRKGDSGVPYLKDIPILGFLFKSRSESWDKTELLIFLTPRIMSPRLDEAARVSKAGGSL